MKHKFRAFFEGSIKRKNVIGLFLLSIMALGIGGAGIRDLRELAEQGYKMLASKVFYDEKASNLKAEQVSAALNEIQMMNPGIYFLGNSDNPNTKFPKITSMESENRGLTIKGGLNDIEFNELGPDGAVKVKGNFEVFNEDDPINPIFSVNAKTGEIVGFKLGDVMHPVLQNGWRDYANGWAPAGYWKDQFGVVHVRGLIERGNTTPGTLIFHLPEEYRPQYGEHFTVRTSGDHSGDVYVLPNGNVMIDTSIYGWLDFAGIAFRTDQ